MGAPADDAGDGEEGGVQLHGDAQQIVEEAAVQVDVGAHALVDGAVFGDELGGLYLDVAVEGQVVLTALFDGQLVDEGAENLLTRVRDGVDRMTHTVDEAAVVKGLLGKDLLEVGARLVGVGPVVQMALDILDHLNDLDVCAAVPGAFQGREGRSNGGVGVRPGGSDHAGGEGRVVAAAVLHVEDEGDVQGLGLQLRVLHVMPQHPQNIFCRGEVRVRAVDVHAVVVLIVVVGVVAVHGQHGELGNEAHALADGIGQIAVDLVIVAGQGEDAAGHGVHDVF